MQNGNAVQYLTRRVELEGLSGPSYSALVTRLVRTPPSYLRLSHVLTSRAIPFSYLRPPLAWSTFTVKVSSTATFVEYVLLSVYPDYTHGMLNLGKHSHF